MASSRGRERGREGERERCLVWRKEARKTCQTLGIFQVLAMPDSSLGSCELLEEVSGLGFYLHFFLPGIETQNAEQRKEALW